jgi:hypothetical protein
VKAWSFRGPGLKSRSVAKDLVEIMPDCSRVGYLDQKGTIPFRTGLQGTGRCGSLIGFGSSRTLKGAATIQPGNCGPLIVYVFDSSIFRVSLQLISVAV